MTGGIEPSVVSGYDGFCWLVSETEITPRPLNLHYSDSEGLLSLLASFIWFTTLSEVSLFAGIWKNAGGVIQGFWQNTVSTAVLAYVIFLADCTTKKLPLPCLLP